MKVIFVTREGYALPGARIRCYNFARELRRRGVQTKVFSYADCLAAQDGERESRMGLGEKIRLNCQAFKILAESKGSLIYLQRFNYHSFAPYLTHLLNKNRMVLDLDDWEMRENPKYYCNYYPSSKAHYFTRQIAARSVFCIAASRFLEEFLSQFNRKVYYIPSGVDTQLFKPALNDTGKDKIIFSWIGTLHKKEYIENINFALGCFSVLRKKYPHIYFEILGDGIYREDLEEVIAQYNDGHIVRKDRIPAHDVPAYLAAVHIGLFPVAKDSKFNLAKSPTKLFEYMAMAKPTVSSSVGEAPHIINDGDNGYLAHTKEEFTEKMERLAIDPELRVRMGEKAHANVVENYSLEVLGKRLHEVLLTHLS